MKTFASPIRNRTAIRRHPAPRVARPAAPFPAVRRAEIHHILHGPRLQAKLAVGAPDDAYERDGDGRRLLAHELTHVVQQGGEERIVQRFVACETGDACPARARGERGRSRSTPMQVEIHDPTTFGVLVSNFAIDDHVPKRDLASNVTWLDFARHMGMPTDQWEILGFTDCLGAAANNVSLRTDRAVEVSSRLPSAARSRVTSARGASLTDCISSNATEADRSRNRSVLVRRVGGSTGPTPGPAPAPIGPVRPSGSPVLFCIPYAIPAVEAPIDRAFLNTVWLPYANTMFGADVHALWRDYLNRPKGSSLAPRVFRGAGHRIVDAFRTDPETVRHRRILFGAIRAAVARTPEVHTPFSGSTYTSPPIPLGSLLPPAMLSRSIAYGNAATQIPGNIAGGTGSSDAGPDQRLFTGDVRVVRTRVAGGGEVKRAQIRLQLQVVDAIDFCPGGAGGLVAQRFTIPMSRLEATPGVATYDLPFHVFVDLSDTTPIP